MPWLDITLRTGTLPKEKLHAMVARLSDVVMWWEKVPDIPAARRFVKAWVHEVAEDCDYTGGHQGEELPFYAVQFRLPKGRLDDPAKAGVIRDITRVVLEAEGAPNTQENAHRVWVHIFEIERQDWGIGGHREWARSYISALEET
jgi:phenylpyruvate tautomerase PptA (4-oxalocrotonate tautomerase family)